MISRTNLRPLLKQLSAAFALLLIWEGSARVGLLNTRVLSSPTEIARSISALTISGTLPSDVFQSVKRVCMGVCLGSLAGVATALLFALRKGVRDYCAFLIEIIRPIPPIAWIPIAILWFGLGDAPAYFLVGLGAFFPIFSSTYRAVRNIDARYVNVALCLGASGCTVFTRVLVPIVLPDILTGLRVGLGVGWIIVITAEMVGAPNGLGYMIQLNRVMLQMPNVIVGMIVIGCIGLALSHVMNAVEALLIPWQRRMPRSE